MSEDAIPLKYVCARWAYSELLSDQLERFTRDRVYEAAVRGAAE